MELAACSLCLAIATDTPTDPPSPVMRAETTAAGWAVCATHLVYLVRQVTAAAFTTGNGRNPRTATGAYLPLADVLPVVPRPRA